MATATDPAAVARLVGGDAVDLLWSDPPYSVAYTGKTAAALTIANDDLGIEGTRDLVAAALRLVPLRAGGAFYLASPAGPAHLAFLLALGDAGLAVHQTLIWVKDRFVLGHSDYHYRHEPILYGWREGTHTFRGDRTQDSVWEIARPARNDVHPTIKPVELVERAIRNSCAPGDTVSDPFVGSGTTIIAAEKTDRRCLAMEIDPRYAQVAIERWQTFTGARATRLSRLGERDSSALAGDRASRSTLVSGRGRPTEAELAMIRERIESLMLAGYRAPAIHRALTGPEAPKPIDISERAVRSHMRAIERAWAGARESRAARGRACQGDRDGRGDRPHRVRPLEPVTPATTSASAISTRRLKAQELLVRLRGLDAPIRTEIAGPGGGPVTVIALADHPAEHLDPREEARRLRQMAADREAEADEADERVGQRHDEPVPPAPARGGGGQRRGVRGVRERSRLPRASPGGEPLCRTPRARHDPRPARPCQDDALSVSRRPPDRSQRGPAPPRHPDRGRRRRGGPLAGASATSSSTLASARCSAGLQAGVEGRPWTDAAWSVRGVDLGKDFTCLAMSLGSVRAGARLDELLADDPVGQQENATAAGRAKALETYLTVVDPMVTPTGKRIFLGTRWHEDDIYAELIRKGWPHLTYRAIDEDGTALWPDYWSAERLAAKRAELGSAIFDLQYQNDPVGHGRQHLQARLVRLGRLGAGRRSTRRARSRRLEERALRLHRGGRGGRG